MESEKKPYLVMLPDEEFENIRKPNKLEITVATTPAGASSNIIARNFEGEKERRRASIGNAIAKLKNSYQSLEEFAYEIPVDILDDQEKPINKNSPDYKILVTGFLAHDIAKRKGGKLIDYLDEAKKAVQIYLDSIKDQ